MNEQKKNEVLFLGYQVKFYQVKSYQVKSLKFSSDI